MFSAKVRSEVLKELVDIVSTLVAETKFNANKDSLDIRTVDLAHVAMIDLSLDSSAFESYKSSEEELGVNLDKMKDVLKLSKTGDIIELKHDEKKSRLVVTVDNITRSMSLVDTAGMSDPKVPNLELPARIVVKTADLARGIQAAQSVSDHVTFIASPDEFDIVAEGDTDKVELTLGKEKLVEINTKEKFKSMFPLDYLARIVKEIKCEEITLNLGTDYPVRMEFTIADGKGKAAYLLAPRIENA
ncbi:MAG: DNA polymerase sliding clamp [Thermoplasmata archaeon]|nr:DNA polymerase sliding clamp [Thermoplasmata archaeon]